MIKTLSPYNSATTAASTTSKTAEILSRYRPIAPKPEIVPSTTDAPSSPSSNSSSSPTSPAMSQKIRQSPYLRNLWPQLQARPTRTRKRGRTLISPPSLKRQRVSHSAAAPPPAAAKSLNFQAFVGLGLTHSHLLPAVNLPDTLAAATATTSHRSLVTLPLLPGPAPAAAASDNHHHHHDIDLNLTARSVAKIPEEKDLLQQLQGATSTTTTSVISPRPLRPVGSSISIGPINLARPANTSRVVPRRPEEVEEEVEAEELPAVISDSSNKVRVANSAYKEMVGQPECPWLDSMVVGRPGGPKRRIGGEVVLKFMAGEELPSSELGFSCWVKIEWGSEPENKKSVKAFCEVNKLTCESKDYLLTWRFHTRQHHQHYINLN